MVRSSHHLPLPSLPPPRVVLCSPFAVLSLSLLPRHRESSKESPGTGAAISPHRIYRADPDPQRAYQYVNESPTGTTVTPARWSPRPSIYIDTISGDRYLAYRLHFFDPPPRRSPDSLSLRMQPPVNHTLPRDIPITNSTPTRSVSCLPVSETHVLFHS